ncbi:MAG: YggS family pyridoxal phosphate-dependent enzyme [Pseudonocardia sp.]|uniref:YggS family pyridoxal phosphate-dependent enzyme n=1 Tax=unclassified Pseudonocardia TaxID=2619320 RepID=UPI00086AD566|nr:MULTISPECIES: YggS family pyridoxal phosphate-dependent enzyme [unclassified Pseudonocardia]MBN9107784.1 YggS family pyridoxal phosphate-dependent enzyme [Pseudonocardia sp.]ODV07511.1 MAG: YggS family pyridoxal phosphate enzyme [Pseudonocardia sp. SCN 73-27]
MSQRPTTDERRHDLTRRLARVRETIARACAAAGRDVDEVDLLAVTKTVPAADVAILLELGLRDFGENRAQEAAEKVGEVARLAPEAAPRWFFVGGLQRNKARLVTPWVTRVESVDSVRLADALDTHARRAVDAGEREGPLPVLLQYSVDGDPARGGVARDGLAALAAHVSGLDGLRLDGLMAVAPLGADPDRAFADVAAAASALRSDHPSARVLSAGMSGDLDVAIRHGSTCVRVGTALVGERRLASR